MHIVFYVFAILLFGGVVVAFFVMRERKQKEFAKHQASRNTESRNNIKVEAKKKAENVEKVEPQVVKQAQSAPTTAIFEDFSLEPAQKPKKPSFFDDLIFEDDEDELEDDDDMEQKFAEYEQFLKNSMVGEPDISSDITIDEDDENIEDIFGNISQNAKDMLLSGALAKKDFDDEED